MAPTTQLHPHALPGRRYGEFGGRAPTIDGVRTALQEQVGGSIIAGFDTDYRLRLPYGYGGCRFYGLIPQGAGLSAILPRTTDPRGGPFHPYCNPGGLPSATIVNAGAFPLAVVTNEHAPVVTLAPLAAASFRVRPGGGWLVKHHGTAGIGATLADRVPVEVRLTESIASGFNLRDRIIAMGYTDPHPAYGVRCTIAAGVVIGNSTTAAAFNTGFWPGGSTLLLVLEQGAVISGVGGRGGRGGDVPPGLLPQAGDTGGAGFRMYLPTALVSFGTIQGGGGGGGGNSRAGTIPGPGGGGGSGYLGGVGGASGNHAGGQGPYPGGQGFNGGLSYPGGGGYTPAGSGAFGGLPGNGGSSASGAGGPGGKAIEKPMGHVLTKIRAGTILGVEDP